MTHYGDMEKIDMQKKNNYMGGNSSHATRAWVSLPKRS